jgi:toxin YoeB
MAKREVIWSKTADIQFAGILEYWLNRNKSSAYPKRLIKLTVQRTEDIANNPEIYKKAEIEGYRVSIIEKFSIYCQVTNKAIKIAAFWDNRQNPDKLLEILTNKK